MEKTVMGTRTEKTINGNVLNGMPAGRKFSKSISCLARPMNLSRHFMYFIIVETSIYCILHDIRSEC
jgi:hypothetical protein